MAIQTNNNGRFGGRARRYQPMAEINVTPFVDVMLVLLIVFMITAPLLTVGVPVDLPKTRAAALSDADEPLVVTINAKGAIFLQEHETPIENLVPRLVAVTGATFTAGAAAVLVVSLAGSAVAAGPSTLADALAVAPGCGAPGNTPGSAVTSGISAR